MSPVLGEATALYVGDRPAVAAYLGGAKVWPRSYVDEVMADGPIGYWRLDEATGLVAHDASGYGRDGAVAGVVLLGQPPLITEGNAATLDGSTGYVTVPHDPALNASGGLTVECWVRIADPNLDAVFPLVDKTGGSSALGQYSLYYDNRAATGSTRRVAFLAGTATNLNNAAVSNFGAQMAAGGHLVVTVSGTSGSETIRIFWNGVVVCTVAGRAITWLPGNTMPLGIGQMTTFYAGATMDEVAIYDHALTTARVAAHYLAGTAHSGVVQTVNLVIGGWDSFEQMVPDTVIQTYGHVDAIVAHEGSQSLRVDDHRTGYYITVPYIPCTQGSVFRVSWWERRSAPAPGLLWCWFEYTNMTGTLTGTNHNVSSPQIEAGVDGWVRRSCAFTIASAAAKFFRFAWRTTATLTGISYWIDEIVVSAGTPIVDWVPESVDAP